MKDWLGLEQVAGAMRRLNRAVATFEVPDEEWREVARVAGELAQRLEGGRVRQKEEDMLTLPFFAGLGEGAPSTAEGDTLEFDPFSLGRGRLHPSSIGIEFRRDGAASVTARCTVHEMFQGPAGRAHCGTVAVIIDELMGMVNRVAGRRAFTARLQLHLRAPTPVGVELTFRAWEHEVDGRKVLIRAEGRSDETLIVEADALFIEVSGVLPDAAPVT